MDTLKELDKLHWTLEKEINDIDNRYWGKRMRQDDMQFITNLKNRLQAYSNQIYIIRQEILFNG